MSGKKKKKSPIDPLPPLVAFWKQERDASGITLEDIEAKTGIPDSTLSRWFRGEVEDLKASQLAKVSLALGIPWWKSMARAQYTDDAPADPTAETERIASIIADEPELQSLLGNVAELGPRDRRAVRKFIEMLKHDDQSGPPVAPESQ